jgi:hypothetical protein
MKMGMAVDADVMNSYLKSLIDGDVRGTVYRLIEGIKAGPGFSIDFAGKIEHQWHETCNHKLFESWFVEAIQAGAIRVVDNEMPEQHKKHLRVNLGFPYNQRFEGTYIEVAFVTDEKVVISEDIDFWSPRDKCSSPERRKELMEGRQGDVYRYLRRRVGIEVHTVAQAALKGGFCADVVGG